MPTVPRIPRAHVLYIHPGKQPVGFPYDQAHSDPAYEIIPVGIIGLLNLLRQHGLSVHGLNYPMERMIDPAFELAAWAQRLGQPQMVLIDLHWYEHSFGALNMAEICRILFPQAPIVLGGLTASLFADEILRDYPHVDYIIRGDAEEPLLRLSQAVCGADDWPGVNMGDIPNLSFRQGGQPCHNERTYTASAADLEGLDFVRTDWLTHAMHYAGFQYVGRKEWAPEDGPTRLGHWLCLGRGCRYDCSYCGGGRESHRIIAGRDGIIVRPPRAVADNIERLQERGIHQVSLALDPHMLGLSYWQRLFGELAQRRVRIGVYNECFQLPSLDFVTSYLSVADLAHSELGLTLISSERVRRFNGKSYSDAQFLRLLSELKPLHVPLRLFFSTNLPGENTGSLRAALRLAERILNLYPRELLTIRRQPHALDPCSPMSRDPERLGIETSYRSLDDYVRYCQRTNAGARDVERAGFRTTVGRTLEAGESDRAWAEFLQRNGLG